MTPARLLRIVRQRLRSLVARRRQDSELDDELSFHLEQIVREKIAEGLTPEEARYAARREFGNVAVVREESRDARRLGWLRDVAQDAAYGWRMLRRQPAFTAVSMTSMAIGIGAATTVWGAARTVLLDPLPFADSERLVAIRTITPDGTRQNLGATSVEYFAWRERSRTLEAFGASMSGPRELGVESDGTPAELVAAQAFTPGLFTLLGVRPAHGRVFDETTNPFSPAARTAIISHRLWQRRYGGSLEAIGRRIPTEGSFRTIVGVMPADFRYQDDTVDLWVPHIFGPNARQNLSDARPFLVTARLRPGATVQDAQADLDRVGAELRREFPDRVLAWRVVVVPLREAIYGWTKPLLFTLGATAALMLLIGCANISGLLLARGTTRQRELWVRRSLGAGGARIVRQLLTESLLLAIGGGALGLALAVPGLRAVSTAMGPPPGLPRVGAIAIDLELAAFALLLAIGAGIAFGLLPAIVGARARIAPGDSASAAGSGEPRGSGIRSALVAGEIALAAILLIAAGLLLGSFVRLIQRDLNFDPENLVSFEFIVPSRDYARQVSETGGMPTFQISTAASEAIGRVYERLRAVPGVESVAGLSYPPVNSLVVPRVEVRSIDAGPPGIATSRSHTLACFFVTPGALTAMRTPIVRGRDVGPADDRLSPGVAIVNEAAARLLWAAGDALGQQVAIEMAPGLPLREIVGIVRDVPVMRRALVPEPVIYVPILQPPGSFRGRAVNLFGHMTFMLRHTGDPAAVVEAARRAAAEVAPARPIVNVGIVTRALDARLSELRNYVVAVGLFGLASLLLSAIGVYGVTSFAVAARVRELCIRRVLGAGSWAVVGTIGRRAAAVSLLGISVGLLLAAGFTGLIESQLWGVAPTDPATFAGAAGLLAAVVALACLSPARRAVAIDPARVLRSE